MIVQAHDLATCQCDSCRLERKLIENGGWEWIDDGRPAQKPNPARYWYIISAVMLAWMAVLLTLLVLFGG